MEEAIVIQVDGTEEHVVEVEEIIQDVEQSETVEYIEAEEPADIVIEVEERHSSSGNASGSFATIEHSHQTDEISGLNGALSILGGTREYYSSGGGIAEFREWKDGNPEMESRIGYFVSLVNDLNNEYIDFCNADATDVYGVTVSSSGICGYQYSDYDMLKSKSNNKANGNKPFDKVCLLGTVRVRFGDDAEFDTLKIGDYVVPDINGCAKKSTNNIGYKVVMKEPAGMGNNAWNRVAITLVPQNDNVSRVMQIVGTTNDTVDNLKDKLDDLQDTVDKNISISDQFGQFDENVNSKLEQAGQALAEAQKITNDAIQAMEQIGSDHKDAIKQTQDARREVKAALDEISKHTENLEIIAEYGDNIAGFFQDATEDGITIGTLVEGIDGGKSSIAQSQNAIQHLVTSVDSYSVGNQSPTDGLTYDGMKGVMGYYEYIYVPTNDHIEVSPIYQCTRALTQGAKYYFEIKDPNNSEIKTTYLFTSPLEDTKVTLIFDTRNDELTIGEQQVEVTKISNTSGANKLELSSEKTFAFTSGYSYVWTQDINSNDVYSWKQDGNVSFESDKVPLIDNYNLWYCRNGVKDYKGNTLYCAMDGLWVAVATINDRNARAVSLMNQTAESFTSTITNINGEIASIRHEVNEISTNIGGSGSITQVNQTAKNILMGAYSKEGQASALEVLLSGLRADTVHTEHILVDTFPDTPPDAVDGYYYDEPPQWQGKAYEFVSPPVNNAEYYFADQLKQKYYRRTNNGYEVWTHGNTAMSSLDTRVTDTESEIQSWTQFETEVSDTMTKISQTSSGNAAEMAHIVMGKFLTKENGVASTELPEDAIVETRYNQEPIWEDEKFKFDEKNINENGKYCVSTNGNIYYALMIDNGGKIVGYEKYEMKSSDYASLVQKIDDKGESYIGLVAGNDKDSGRFIINTINDRSTILIDADKIGINGTAIFTDDWTDSSTTISGGFMKSVVLQSNNFNGPVTKVKYGYKIDETGVLHLSENHTCTFTTGETSYLAPDDKTTIELDSGKGLVGVDLGIESTTYYCRYENETYEVPVGARTVELDDSTSWIEFTYKLEDLPIDKGSKVYLYEGEYKYQIVEGEESDCIYYTEIEVTAVDLDHKIFPLAGTYYFGDSSATNTWSTKITKDQNDIWRPDKAAHVISSRYFDLIPFHWAVNGDDVSFNEHILGTKIDLNSGTIFSKNFILDNEGDISIRGSLMNNQASIWGTRTRKTPGVYVGPDGIGVGDGALGIRNDGYFATQGNLEVYSTDNDTTKVFFGVYPRGSKENIFGESDDRNTGTVIIDGNINLNGNITLTGNITWSASSNPVKVLYSANGGKPTYEDWLTATETKTDWHTKYVSDTDHYASYSYNGGQEWCDGIKIKGEDFSGGDITLDETDVFNMLTANGSVEGIFPFDKGEDADGNSKLFINATYIRGGTLSGVTIESAMDTSDPENNLALLKSGALSFYSKRSDYINEQGEYLNENSSFAKLEAGCSGNQMYPYIRWGQGDGNGSQTVNEWPTVVYGTGMIWKDESSFSIGMIGGSESNPNYQVVYFKNNQITFHNDVVIDFSPVKQIKGLAATATFG